MLKKPADLERKQGLYFYNFSKAITLSAVRVANSCYPSNGIPSTSFVLWFGSRWHFQGNGINFCNYTCSGAATPKCQKLRLLKGEEVCLFDKAKESLLLYRMQGILVMY